MSSLYLQTSDYAAYGLPASLSASLVTRASAIIDGYCHRAMAVTTYTERLRLPVGRNRVLLSYGPLVEITSAQGRYGYPRRGATMQQVFPATSLYQLSSVFGGPPSWEDIDTTQIVIDARTGEVWLPAGIYLAHYTDVEIVYTAGYATVPDNIKAACALLAFAILERAAALSMKGRPAREPGGHSYVDRDIAALLEPYRARVMR